MVEIDGTMVELSLWDTAGVCAVAELANVQVKKTLTGCDPSHTPIRMWS